MQPKATLTYDGAVREISPRDLKNWGDVMCSYSRSGYGGVVRSFTSKFEFVGQTANWLRSIYLSDGVEAQCSLAIYTLENDWTHSLFFECPLDFSSISWDGHTASISAVDQSLAAMIKSEKSTKYELAVGEDIAPDTTFHFDRIPMQESATYAFTQGESDSEDGSLYVRQEEGLLPWLGLIGSETCVNNAVHYLDDQEAEGGYVLEAVKAIDITVEWDIDYSTAYGSGANINLRVASMRTGQGFSLGNIGGEAQNQFVGTFASAGQLPNLTSTSDIGKWALVQGSDDVWIVDYAGRCYWRNTGQTERECLRRVVQGSQTISLAAGERLQVIADFYQPMAYSMFKLYSSRIVFKWAARGEACDIPCFAPKTLGEALLRRMAKGGIDPRIEISAYDARMAKTRIMAAESIRGIPGAKLYSTFGEYCDWMEAVFGYVYWIGEAQESEFTRVAKVGSVIATGYSFLSQQYQGQVDPLRIVYVPYHGRFLYQHTDGNFYVSFVGWEQYCDNNGKPLPGVVYDFEGRGLCYFEADGIGGLKKNPTPYPYDPSKVGEKTATVHFLHRSELFNPNVGKTIENAAELRFSVKPSQIYSSVTVGYDKKDYDSVNGRDEFNFSIDYSTGSRVSERKLSLMSKYRADSYGIEFAAQKRSKDTTDSDSDSDVFFAYCTLNRQTATPDRTAAISGVLTDQVFNGAFNPRACALANAGYIGMQSENLTLAFASATGNSEVEIGGARLGSDVPLGQRLFTSAEIDFSTDDQQIVANKHMAVKVTHCGTEYVGFISDADFKTFRPEPAKYKLIVKSVNAQW